VKELRGDGRVQSAHIAGRKLDRHYDVDVVALNLGFQPETGLARALGVKQRFVDVGLGHLASDSDEDGRTSVAGVFAVGDGASLGGARVAMARGRLAGLAAARELGLQAPDEPATRAALRRALAFQDALWTLFRPIRLRPGTLTDDTIVCRCEEVTAGRRRVPAWGDARAASVRPPSRGSAPMRRTTTPSPHRARRCVRCLPRH
jgi:NAD(P)H-nitrite reductase large subunit